MLPIGSSLLSFSLFASLEMIGSFNFGPMSCKTLDQWPHAGPSRWSLSVASKRVTRTMRCNFNEEQVCSQIASAGTLMSSPSFV